MHLDAYSVAQLLILVLDETLVVIRLLFAKKIKNKRFNQFQASFSILQQKLKEYSLGDIFNFDETALFYRLRLDKILASKEIKGQKKVKKE